MLLAPIPLVLDLDGTVIRTDTFHEMMRCLLTQNPLILFRLPFWFLKGRAYAKAQLVEHVEVDLEALPYNKQLLAFAQKEGRPLILATGTDQRLAQKISDHLGIFQETIGSDGTTNMTGNRKGNALLEKFGAQGFDYAGDSSVDISVWQLSRKALVVCPKWRVLKKVRALKDSEHIQIIPREQVRALSFIFALRPLFWGFNFVDSSMSLFIGHSLLASGLLILNDLLLVDRERKGPCKRQSVFAEGRLHLITAFIMAPSLLFSSLLFLSPLSRGYVYLGVYIPLFIGLDRLTRTFAQSLRWVVFGLLQIFFLVVVGLQAVSLPLPQ